MPRRGSCGNGVVGGECRAQWGVPRPAGSAAPSGELPRPAGSCRAQRWQRSTNAASRAQPRRGSLPPCHRIACLDRGLVARWHQIVIRATARVDVGAALPHPLPPGVPLPPGSAGQRRRAAPRREPPIRADRAHQLRQIRLHARPPPVGRPDHLLGGRLRHLSRRVRSSVAIRRADPPGSVARGGADRRVAHSSVTDERELAPLPPLHASCNPDGSSPAMSCHGLPRRSSRPWSRTGAPSRRGCVGGPT
jgi:hypothetical protein